MLKLTTLHHTYCTILTALYTCKGLPSISADDPAFPALGYWRGYVWGPMAMLTYWGLDNYPSVPTAVQARQSLAKQMNAMMLKQWSVKVHTQHPEIDYGTHVFDLC